MSKLKKSSIVLIVVGMLLSLSAVAMAEHNDTHPEETQFSFGYDRLNHFLAINIGPTDNLYKCVFENGTLTATYGAGTDGVIPVNALVVKATSLTKSFDARTAAELPAGVTPAVGTTPYVGATGVCGVNGVIVAGPNGQINHGQFMKAAKGLIAAYFEAEGLKGHGCVTRFFAQSDIGRTPETRLSVTDAAGLILPLLTSGDIDFITGEADCSRGKKGQNPAVQPQSGNRGKSAQAPGKNK